MEYQYIKLFLYKKILDFLLYQEDCIAVMYAVFADEFVYQQHLPQNKVC